MASSHGDESSAASLVPATEHVSEAPGWELRMLLERAAELETLQRFEEALVLYHRGRRRAPLPLVATFQDGVQRAERAVQSSIGPGAAPLFANLPELLPGMIEEQRTARTEARAAARRAHDRLREAINNMTFAERKRDDRHQDDDDDDDDVDGGRQVAVRGAVDGAVAVPSGPRRRGTAAEAE